MNLMGTVSIEPAITCPVPIRVPVRQRDRLNRRRREQGRGAAGRAVVGVAFADATNHPRRLIPTPVPARPTRSTDQRGEVTFDGGDETTSPFRRDNRIAKLAKRPRPNVREAAGQLPLPAAKKIRFAWRIGKLRQLALHPDEFAPRIAVLLEPIGVDQPRPVVSGVLQDGPQKLVVASHYLPSAQVETRSASATISSTTAPAANCCGVQYKMRQPRTAAAEYFTRSARKPFGRTCRPRPHAPPSTSSATLASTNAKSNRQRRVG